jgi:hypothetical protein
VRQSVPAGEHRRRYIEAHQRAAQRLQAAEALRAPTALGTYLQRVAEAASAAAASAWDQILDEWKRDFPLPKGDES